MLKWISSLKAHYFHCNISKSLIGCDYGPIFQLRLLVLANVNRKKKQFDIKIVVQPDFISLKKSS